MRESESDWKRMPSGLWDTKKVLPFGTVYRCTECQRVSLEWGPLTKMHEASCDRINRGNCRKPLQKVEGKPYTPPKKGR